MISILVLDYGLDPDTLENMRLRRLFTYADMAIDLNKERRKQSESPR